MLSSRFGIEGRGPVDTERADASFTIGEAPVASFTLGVGDGLGDGDTVPEVASFDFRVFGGDAESESGADCGVDVSSIEFWVSDFGAGISAFELTRRGVVGCVKL